MSTDYAQVHVYWCSSVFVYFAVGAVLCSLILSPQVAIGSFTYQILVILYTAVGLILITAWSSIYSSYSNSRSLFGSTLVTVPAQKDSEYAVVHALYVQTALVSIIVLLIFWIWFLIYYSAVDVTEIDSSLQVYSVVLLPLTFFILIFFAASWWIPSGSRRICPHTHLHICTTCTSKDYIEKHTEVEIHF